MQLLFTLYLYIHTLFISISLIHQNSVTKSSSHNILQQNVTFMGKICNNNSVQYSPNFLLHRDLYRKCNNKMWNKRPCILTKLSDSTAAIACAVIIPFVFKYLWFIYLSSLAMRGRRQMVGSFSLSIAKYPGPFGITPWR